jgi:hypothetical protein
MPVVILRTPASKYASVGGGGGATGITFDSGWTGTGTFADGQFVTITRGAGISGTVRTDERPLKWIPGTGISGDATYSRDSTTLTLQNNATVGQSSILPYSGHVGTLDQQFVITPTDACFFQTNPITSIGTTQQAFISWYVRFGYSHTSDGSNNKMARIWNTAMTSSMYAPNHFVQTLSEDGANTAGGFFYDINDASNTWYVYEYEFRENSATDVHDGLWQFAMNAGLASADSTLWTTRESGFDSDSLHHRVFGPQQSNQPPPANGTHLYMADLYVSDTLLRTFVSTESAYTTSVYAGGSPLTIERQVQLMRSTGNTSTTLSLLLRAGAYAGSLSGKYLWVVASDRTRYRVGQFT